MILSLPIRRTLWFIAWLLEQMLSFYFSLKKLPIETLKLLSIYVKIKIYTKIKKNLLLIRDKNI